MNIYRMKNEDQIQVEIKVLKDEAYSLLEKNKQLYSKANTDEWERNQKRIERIETEIAMLVWVLA